MEEEKEEQLNGEVEETDQNNSLLDFSHYILQSVHDLILFVTFLFNYPSIFYID